MDFSTQLIIWYENNKRDLPWRNTSNPYFIWLSEIILQQTRVDQGISYYHKFITHYPTIDLLANAKEEEVLKLWQGLGYYSRARNLHASAKIVNNELDGIFPNNHSEIIALKGVGEYTAAAVASFAFKLPFAVIDGNVYRVLARLFGIHTAIDSNEGKKVFKELASELLDKQNPSTYNQAIMEFGALQCKPKNPNCESCPFRLECVAFKNETISILPYKSKKTKQRNRYFNYLVIESDFFTFIKKRGKNDIWQGLFDFPLIETLKEIQDIEELNFSEINKKITSTSFIFKGVSKEYKHILSHQKIYAKFWKIELIKEIPINTNYISVSNKDLGAYPVPKLIDNYLNETNF